MEEEEEAEDEVEEERVLLLAATGAMAGRARTNDSTAGGRRGERKTQLENTCLYQNGRMSPMAEGGQDAAREFEKT